MEIVTWNIQCGLGCDGTTDLVRIARVLRAMGEADVICLQEVSRHDPAIAGGADQAAELEALFPGYRGWFAAGLDRYQIGSEKRRQFGNLLLSRRPVLQLFRHALPDPADGTVKHMPRAAIEAVVETRAGPLRVLTTHLEYYSAAHRRAQVERLHALQAEAAANAASPPLPGEGPFAPAPRPASAVLCGDMNLLPAEEEYRLLFRLPFIDAWRHACPGEPDPPTTGLFDRTQWPDGGHCRDYFAVTPDIAQRTKSVEMDSQTDASDHQPLRIVLAD